MKEKSGKLRAEDEKVLDYVRKGKGQNDEKWNVTGGGQKSL